MSRVLPVSKSPTHDWRPSREKVVGITVAHLTLLFVPATFTWPALGVFAFLYWLTLGVGLTLGYHRLLSHRSLEVPKWLEYAIVTCGALANQGGPIEWIGTHRLHHQYSDKDGDPHNASEGFWWSHILWLFGRVPSEAALRRRTRDLNGDPYYEFLHRGGFTLLTLGLAVALYAVGGWPYVVYGVFLRIVVVFHTTWFVNSVTHKFGYRNYATRDSSTNCWWVAILTFGEGWHNNHHAVPNSARHGLRAHELDVTWLTIALLRWLGLASRVQVAPPPNALGEAASGVAPATP